jgi:RNA polymerase sigma-70 factor (ECF subfamily)
MTRIGQPSDGEVVTRVLAGNTDAFALLVRRHQNALYGYGRSTGLDHDTALDLVQESFVKAFERLRQCREPERFLSWLFRIFRNAVLDWARNIRRTEAPLEHAEWVADDGDVAEGVALRDGMGSALAALSPILREAFLLRHQVGHSYEEIAEITGVSLSAAKMRVARARDLLHDALVADYGNVTRAGSRAS